MASTSSLPPLSIFHVISVSLPQPKTGASSAQQRRACHCKQMHEAEVERLSCFTESETREEYGEASETTVVASFMAFEDACQCAERQLSKEGPFKHYERSRREIDDDDDGYGSDGNSQEEEDDDDDDDDDENVQGCYIKASDGEGE